MHAQLTETQVWEFPGPNFTVVGYTLTLHPGDVVDIVGWCRQTRELACRMVHGGKNLLLGVNCPVIACDDDEPLSVPQDSRNEQARLGVATVGRAGRGTDGLTRAQRVLLQRIGCTGDRGLPVQGADLRVAQALQRLKRVEPVAGRKIFTVRLKPGGS